MGGLVARVGLLLNFERKAGVSRAIVDAGGANYLSCEYYQSSGEDTYPVPGDYVLLVPALQNGQHIAIGIVDTDNAQNAAIGESRTYSRNASGQEQASVWLKNNGDIELTNGTASGTLAANGAILFTNGAGSFGLDSGGNFIVNGVTIDTGGNISGAATMEAGGVEFTVHIHTQPNDAAGNGQAPTSPPL